VKTNAGQRRRGKTHMLIEWHGNMRSIETMEQERSTPVHRILPEDKKCRKT
jgi:hypothetical protein